MDTAVTHKDLALAWLFIGATFFTMRSCEYLKTNHNEDSKRTKIIRLRNIRFKKNGRMLDMGKDKLTEADLVAITFEFQKNDKRDKTVHMFKTNDGIMCPVVAWASTVKRLVNTIPLCTADTTVCSYLDNITDKAREIYSSHARIVIKGIVEIMGEKVLGFTKEEVGLHSIRSGGAMAMFLSGVSEIIIQRVGRWESFAFLDYIREQVENFTFGVSGKMLQSENFQHLNDRDFDRQGKSDSNNPKELGDVESHFVPLSIRFSKQVLFGEKEKMNLI